MPLHLVVSTFGFSLAISITLGGWLLIRTAKANGITPSEAIRWLILSLLGGFLGARLGYVAVNFSGSAFLHDCLDFEHGGLFGYGAYVGGLLGPAIKSRRDFRLFRNWLDGAAPVVLVGIGLTRLGCYFQGSDFGRPLGVKPPRIVSVLGTFPRWSAAPDGTFSGSAAWLHHVSSLGLSPDATASLPVHPTQLYEATFALVAALMANYLLKPKNFAGRTFLITTMILGVGCYSLDFLRGDPERGLLFFARGNRVGCFGSWTQILALGSVAAAALVWRKWKRGEKTWGGNGELNRAAENQRQQIGDESHLECSERSRSTNGPLFCSRRNIASEDNV
jgi:phosphatidylglycerol:prolipoprotein diacylglycerol transferase